VTAGRLEVSRGGGLDSGVLLDDESADVTVDLVASSRYPGGALTDAVRASSPVLPMSLRRLDT
jgi:hypothetical protein